MRYVLIYVDSENMPQYLQGSIDEINAKVHTLWANGDLDRDDWEFREPWHLFGIEGDQLIEMEQATCTKIPHFEVI